MELKKRNQWKIYWSI